MTEKWAAVREAREALHQFFLIHKPLAMPEDDLRLKVDELLTPFCDAWNAATNEALVMGGTLEARARAMGYETAETAMNALQALQAPPGVSADAALETPVPPSNADAVVPPDPPGTIRIHDEVITEATVQPIGLNLGAGVPADTEVAIGTDANGSPTT